ncbi:MAG: PAS domain-containing protein [Verrucomicrobiota bacterium]
MKPRFFHSLLFKIGAGVIAVELLALAVMGIFYVRRFQTELDEQLNLRLQVPSELIARNLLSHDSITDAQTMFHLVGEELVDSLLVTSNKEVIKALRADLAGSQVTAIPELNPAWFCPTNVWPILESKHDGTNQCLISITAISRIGSSQPVLYCYLKVKTEETERNKRELAFMFFAGSVLTLVTTSAVIVLLFRWTVADRMEPLVAGMRRVESGDLSMRAPIAGIRDEIELLQLGINSMVQALEKQVSELQVAKKRWATQYAVSQILNEAKHFEEAAQRVLQTFCQNFEWASGQCWMVHPETHELVPTQTWPADPQLDPAKSWGLSQHPSEIAERVRASGFPLVLRDPSSEPHPEKVAPEVPRKQAICAFPIRSETQIYGVMMVCSPEIRRDEKQLLEIVHQIGAQLGRFIQGKQVEAALIESEERFRLIARATDDTLWDWNIRTQHIWCSDGFQRLFGWDISRIPPGLDWWHARLHPHERASVLARFQAVLDCREQFWSDEYRFRRADGTYAFVLNRGYIHYDSEGQPTRMIGSLMDITDRKLAEEERLRLTGRIMEAQESERGRVARELHDGVNQILAAAKFRVHLLEEKLQQTGNSLESHAGKARDLLEKALKEVRLISRNLRPSELDDLGLLAAVRSACDEFQRRHPVSLQLHCNRFPEVLPPEMELMLYRIIQEALSNIEKHSEATRVSIQLIREGLQLELTITDNGRGFDEENHPAGLGLMNIRERAAFMGGNASIISLPQRGTEIYVRVPLSGVAEKHPSTLYEAEQTDATT